MLAKMIQGQLASQQTAAAQTQPAPADRLTDQAAQELAAILDDYLAVGAKLADDNAQKLAQPANDIAVRVDRMLKLPAPNEDQDKKFWQRHAEPADIRARALALAASADIAHARETFADLTVALDALLKAVGVPAQVPFEPGRASLPHVPRGAGRQHLAPAGRRGEKPVLWKIHARLLRQTFRYPSGAKGEGRRARGERRRAKSEQRRRKDRAMTDRSRICRPSPFAPRPSVCT